MKAMKECKNFIIGACVLFPLFFELSACGNSSNTNERNAYRYEEDTVIVEAIEDSDVGQAYDYDRYQEESTTVQESMEQRAKELYKQKYDEVHIADIYLLYADGKKIWYCPWTSENEYGYSNKLFEYDSWTDSERVISLNKTSMADDEMCVEGIESNKGVLTVIMSESRNSDGWVEGTYVWQYNCNSGDWKPLAKACSGAEFSADRKAVIIKNAICVNPDAICTADKRYRFRTKTIKL